MSSLEVNAWNKDFNQSQLNDVVSFLIMFYVFSNCANFVLSMNTTFESVFVESKHPRLLQSTDMSNTNVQTLLHCLSKQLMFVTCLTNIYK